MSTAANDAMVLHFFFYGSLMRGMLNHHALDAYFGAGASAADAAAVPDAASRCRFVRRARTAAAGHLFGLSSRAYPFLTFLADAAPPGAPAPQRVSGELWAVDARCADGLARLDALEEGYAKREVDLELEAEAEAEAGDGAGVLKTLAARAILYSVEEAGAVADLWRQTRPATRARRPRLAIVEGGDWAAVGMRATGRAIAGVEELIPDDDGGGEDGFDADASASSSSSALTAAASAAAVDAARAAGAGSAPVTSAAAEDSDAGGGDMSEVARAASGFRLLIGDLGASRNAAALRAAGVTHVVNCAVADLPRLQWAPFAEERHYHFVVASDNLSGEDAAAQWRGAAAFLRSAMAEGPAAVALVHCYHGQNRSVVTAAAFMALAGLAPSVDEALREIRRRRPGSKPKAALAAMAREWVASEEGAGRKL
jgi:gamma-glutamylcyclotransferase (GGCT)/AIG2-like uncharacterized protein YtfP/predicted protein tyrosine phosphatase